MCVWRSFRGKVSSIKDHQSKLFLADDAKEAKDFIKKCDKCQRYVNVQQIPGEKMTTITSPWPFAQWRIDIVGLLPQGKKQVKIFLAAINYFTK